MAANAESLINRAIAQTGLSDFGPGDWRDGFERLVAAIPQDLGADAEAAERIENIVIRRLVNRLRIEGWYAEHGGEAEAHPIEGPLIVIGTGRSGTTAAHYLLAVDPRFRTLRKWEIEDPVPPPDLATEAEDPRRPKAVEANVRHIVGVDGPTEDRRILELAFHDDAMPLALPSFTEYWRRADHRGAFPYHERVLRMLHSHRPPHRWLLKSPDFMYNLEAVAGHYPDARFVVTHRDPLKVIPSACSVIADSIRQRLPDWRFDETFGRQTLDHLHQAVERGMAARAVIGEDRFVDVGQAEIHADPIGVATRVYRFAGLELEDPVRAEMLAWSAANRAGSRGEHRYSAEEFGLSDGLIRERFSDYISRFSNYFAA